MLPPTPPDANTFSSRLTDALISDVPLPPIPRDANKFSRGSLLVLGGSRRFPGAAILAAQAAARTGAGYVTLAVPEPIVAVAQAHLLTIPVLGAPADASSGSFAADAFANIRSLVKHCDAIVLGPGLSLTEASIAFVVSVLDATDAETPLLIDADALNALAAVGERKPPVVSHEGTEPGEESINSVTQGLTRNLALESAGGLRVKPAMTGRGVINRRLPGSILTPHAGELDRLLKAFNCENAEALTQELCAIVVAKGPETRILSPDGRTLTNSNGTPALATAGTGDVLSGIIGSLLAQGLAPFEAATLGVELHAQAGKRAEQELGTRSVIATDLLAQLPQVLKGVSS